MSEVKDKYSLEDLNELAAGLGDHVYCLLDSVSSFSSLCDAQEKIEKMLAKKGIKTEDVFVEKGMAEGRTISEAIKIAVAGYQFQNQFDV